MEYITIREVILFNSYLISTYSPKEQKGVKDESLLDSAVNRPKQTAFGQEIFPTLYDKCAALYHALIKNHAFHNANKRTALMSLIRMLDINGYEFMASQEDAENMTVEIADIKPEDIDTEQLMKDIADWIENNSRKKE
ncbi:type II toxin-antitoxin system death-on-curing family toxin [Salicibibacter cibarius]|uniref:Type II toxin-antitoxin system death-on-curing family toxin n=1 Tax=Salicibibacter cibarius TaxID=2743000 RepID=A0A7T6Z7D1_9BACI|nr:type II toxin-antitoxin system death-on-curing family toxin [Salicibibacter cibarius]QQK78027.1 type II toxin-antitoxin system death-on-curing family toxin [Salicibibacter cibarius]